MPHLFLMFLMSLLLNNSLNGRINFKNARYRDSSPVNSKKAVLDHAHDRCRREPIGGGGGARGHDALKKI